MMLPSLLIVAALLFTGKLADRIQPISAYWPDYSFCDRHRHSRCRRQYVVFLTVFRRRGRRYELYQSVHYERALGLYRRNSAGGGAGEFRRQFSGSMGLTAWVGLFIARNIMVMRRRKVRQLDHGECERRRVFRGTSWNNLGRFTWSFAFSRPARLASGRVRPGSSFLCAMIPAYPLGRIKKWRCL